MPLLLTLLVVVLRARAHTPEKIAPAASKPVAVLRVHRRAAPAWSAAERNELRATVLRALEPGIDGAQRFSCAVIAQDGAVLFDDDASRAVIPASAQKLIVTDAALQILGPRYVFETFFAAMHAPEDGTLPGDLYLAGSGDPSLRSSDLRAGAAALRREGVTAVQGHLIIDPSAIAGEEINPFWSASDANEDYMSPVSGVSLDEDTVEFHVTGTQDGMPARVAINPPSRAVTYGGAVMTGGGDDVIVAATDEENYFRLAGNVPPQVEETFYVPVHDIPRYVGAVTSRLLHEQGIDVADPSLTGTVPIDARILWDHRSKPLAALLKHMLIVSDNHYAEQVMRTLGGADGAAADDADGIAAERRVLAEQGIPAPGLHLVDGSGLARDNRVAAITLARILARADADPRGNMLYPLLARGGVDGTLKYYDFHGAHGRVRAKTGHLDGVSSLAGYIDTRKHGRVVFAFLINGSPGDPDDAMIHAVDAIAQR